MKEKNILLLTKDALCKDYLPVYGNRYWSGKTPNLDELAAKGTIFNRHYTAAPSTVMAFRAMSTGKFAYEQPYSNYTPKEVDSGENDLFEIAKKRGYEGHLIWDSTWVKMVLRYGNCYGNNTIIHNLDNIKQAVGCHYKHKGNLICDEEKVIDTINRITLEVKAIIKGTDKAFVWIHLPHVINGRTAYGGDIDAFDMLIGRMRELFSDENIFISADHGNMNGYKGKWCYGFDVNTPSIEIPLISPQVEGVSKYDGLTSNIDLKTLIFERRIKKRHVVFCDSAYYTQPHRKLAIIMDNFAYIYNKTDRSEELYDLENDRYERCNLLQFEAYDPDRKLTSPIRDYYFSPYWEQVDVIIGPFRNMKNEIWRTGTFYEEIKEKYLRQIKSYLVKYLVSFNLLKKVHE